MSVAYAVKHPEQVGRPILYGGYARGRYCRGAFGEERCAKAETMIVAHLASAGAGKPGLPPTVHRHEDCRAGRKRKGWLMNCASQPRCQFHAIPFHSIPFISGFHPFHSIPSFKLELLRAGEIFRTDRPGREQPGHCRKHWCLTPKTVRNHVSHIYSKLAVTSRAQAIVLAARRDWGAPAELRSLPGDRPNVLIDVEQVGGSYLFFTAASL